MDISYWYSNVRVILFVVVNDRIEENYDISYEIVTDDIKSFQVENNDRGYELIEEEGFYYLVIKYGEHFAYYSKLDVRKVEVDGKDLKVYVELPQGEGIGEAFSYPKAVIKLDQKPENVIIKYK